MLRSFDRMQRVDLRVLSRFLFQTPPTAPPTFDGVGALIAAIAVAAAYLPAKRAGEGDPISVLRE
jgi:hypothetical protein